LAIKWHKFDDYSTLGGGPVGIMPPGTLTHIKNLRKPEKNIHFASTQLATCSVGYMDGAI
jgi:monoamine oxidase